MKKLLGNVKGTDHVGDLGGRIIDITEIRFDMERLTPCQRTGLEGV